MQRFDWLRCRWIVFYCVECVLLWNTLEILLWTFYFLKLRTQVARKFMKLRTQFYRHDATRIIQFSPHWNSSQHFVCFLSQKITQFWYLQPRLCANTIDKKNEINGKKENQFSLRLPNSSPRESILFSSALTYFECIVWKRYFIWY